MKDEKVEVYAVKNHSVKHIKDKIKDFFSFLKGSRF